MSDEISGLINQAKSQTRLDNIFKFFGKNAKLLAYIALVIFAIGLVALVFSIYQNNAKEKYSAMLHQSLIYQQLGEYDNAKAELEKIVNSSAPSGVKSIASLRYAGFLLEERDLEGVKKIYNEVRDCMFCDDYVRDLASLLLVRVMISDESELADPEALINKISKIEKQAKPLKNHIAEQLAMLELVLNNPKNSYKIFERISKDESSSKVLVARAEDGMKIAVSQGYQPQN